MAGRIIPPRDWATLIAEKREAIALAYGKALRKTADNIVKQGRQDIAAAGSGFLHGQWIRGLKARFEGIQGTKTSPNAKAIIFHRYGIAGVFEHGAHITGKPLLWIPTTRRAPWPSKSGKKLVYATLRGQPVLFDASDPDRQRKPLYIGVRSVDVPKKFHIFQIAKVQAAKLAAMFHGFLKD